MWTLGGPTRYGMIVGNAKLTVRAGAVEVAGRERAETAGQTLCVGLGSLDGGSGSNDSSNSVSELHLGLVDNGDRKGLIRGPESKERVGQRSDVWHEAEGLGNL